MDKNFIENCKLLKRQFTQLTQADTTVQSAKNANKTNTTKVINDAKRLLLLDETDDLINSDIEFQANSVIEYAKALQKLEFKPSYRKTLCQKEIIKWNDELFSMSLPHPKNNLKFLKYHKINEMYHNNKSNKEIEKMAKIILNKYENSNVEDELSKKNKNIGILEIDNEKTNDNENVNIINENMDKKIDENKDELLKTIENTEKTEKILLESPTNIIDIPELKITSQNMSKVDFLEIKKINIEDKEIPNFDNRDILSDKLNTELLSKSLGQWKKFVRRNKNTEHNKKIDNFLNNLQKFKMSTESKTNLIEKVKENTKPKSCSYLETKISSYEHRFKAQKDIIATQKQKLDEQNKIIEELKLNKIHKEAKASLEKGKELRKSITYSSKYNVKRKSEKPDINEIDNNNINVNLSLNFSKAPRIVKMMENRAKERHEKRLLIQERKRLIEEEKKRQAEELAQRKIKEETEEKQKRTEQMKKHREMVRRLELKKQMEKKRYIKINEIASEHYKKFLKQYGLKHLKMLLYNVKIKSEIAKRFYENNIVIKCFQFWWNFVKEIMNHKNSLAKNIYTQKLLENSISCWKNHHFEAIQCKQVAIDRYEMSLQIKYFTAWHRLVCENHIQYTIDVQKADKYYNRFLLIHCLENWRSLPAIMQIERVQNERKRKWRLRVAEVLADYDPLKNYE